MSEPRPYAYILRRHDAHGRIQAIGIADAKTMPGARDLHRRPDNEAIRHHQGRKLEFKRPRTAPNEEAVQVRCLGVGEQKVRYVGDSRSPGLVGEGPSPRPRRLRSPSGSISRMTAGGDQRADQPSPTGAPAIFEEGAGQTSPLDFHYGESPKKVTSHAAFRAGGRLPKVCKLKLIKLKGGWSTRLARRPRPQATNQEGHKGSRLQKNPFRSARGP